MSRTDELRIAGASERGVERESNGGVTTVGDTPFVKWPQDDYAWVEGTVLEIWEGQYGENVKLSIIDSGPEDGPLPGSTVNVGLNSAALRDKVTKEDLGKGVHIAFCGWKESCGGNRYRLFTVIEFNGGNTETDLGVASNLEAEETITIVADDELPF